MTRHHPLVCVNNNFIKQNKLIFPDRAGWGVKTLERHATGFLVLLYFFSVFELLLNFKCKNFILQVLLTSTKINISIKVYHV
jgi:hypothetical protein